MPNKPKILAYIFFILFFQKLEAQEQQSFLLHLSLQDSRASNILNTCDLSVEHSSMIVTFTLKKLGTRFFLTNNITQKHQIIKDSELLFYVVLNNREQTLILGRKNHFLLANKAEDVLAAGELIFDEEGKIIEINDKSGAYHLSPLQQKNDVHKKFIKDLLIKKFKAPKELIKLLCDVPTSH